jgi:hypothetical protein
MKKRRKRRRKATRRRNPRRRKRRKATRRRRNPVGKLNLKKLLVPKKGVLQDAVGVVGGLVLCETIGRKATAMLSRVSPQLGNKWVQRVAGVGFSVAAGQIVGKVAKNARLGNMVTLGGIASVVSEVYRTEVAPKVGLPAPAGTAGYIETAAYPVSALSGVGSYQEAEMFPVSTISGYKGRSKFSGSRSRY